MIFRRFSTPTYVKAAVLQQDAASHATLMQPAKWSGEGESTNLSLPSVAS